MKKATVAGNRIEDLIRKGMKRNQIYVILCINEAY
jgi:hypothetical protein